MSKKFSRKILSTVIAASFVAEAVPVLAQGALEEVVVTARKREESILKVPVTMTAFTGEMLDQFAISDVKGIADLTPGLNFSAGPLSSGVLVSMRGIGTGTNNPAVDQSVALVSDGMQFTQGLAFKAATFDLAQVEVMKGPQALFFGKAAPAGVIAVRSADPTDETEVSLQGGYENEAEANLAKLIVSGPVTDTLGLRLAAQYLTEDGYFTNNAVPTPVPADSLAARSGVGDMGAAAVTEKNFPNTDSLLLRGTALWNPTERLSARLKLNYADQKSEGNGGEPQLVSCPDGTVPASQMGALGLNFIGGDDCKLDDKQNYVYLDPAQFPGIYNGGVPFADQTQYFGSLELNYDLGNDLSLTSVTGYYDVNQKSMLNGNLTTTLGAPFVIEGEMDRTDFTQELRLTSEYSSAVNFMVGAFYQDGQTDYESVLPANQSFNTLFTFFGRPAAFGPVIESSDHTVDAQTYSLFGQVLWQISSDLELGVGARWTDEQRDHSAVNLAPTYSGKPAQKIDLVSPDIGDKTWSPEASLTWTPTDDLTLYGNIKQAYKSGSFDIGGTPQEGVENSFGDERIRGGELGIKTRMLDGSLAVNTAAYYYDYEDMQVESRVFDPLAGVVGVRTTNAASSEIYGVDLDVNFMPAAVEGLVLFGAVNWNIAEYKDFPDASCYDSQLWGEGCNQDADGDGIGDAQDLSGEELLRAPEWMANFGFDYQRPVFDGMTLRIGSVVTYSDSYSASSTNIPTGFQDSYTKTNANISLSGVDDRWKVELIGNNLGDELVFGNCAPAPYQDTFIFGSPIKGTGTVDGAAGGKAENACWAEPGRSVWLRLTWNFI